MVHNLNFYFSISFFSSFCGDNALGPCTLHHTFRLCPKLRQKSCSVHLGISNALQAALCDICLFWTASKAAIIELSSQGQCFLHLDRTLFRLSLPDACLLLTSILNQKITLTCSWFTPPELQTIKLHLKYAVMLSSNPPYSIPNQNDTTFLRCNYS